MIRPAALGLAVVMGPRMLGAQDLAAYVARELGTLQARTSLYARHIPSGKELSIRADVPMNTLSVIKVPVMIQVFRDAETGRLSLSERHPIKPEELRRGSGLLQTFEVGLAPTIRDLVEQMIITSDNTATDILIHRVGLTRVNEMLAQFGFKETRLRTTTGDLFRALWVSADAKNRSMTDREVFQRGVPGGPGAAERSFAFEGDSALWLGRTTAREISVMLEGIMNATYASRAHSDDMLGMLRRQFYASRLPQRLSGKAQVAHKTGDWPPYAGNDVGILYYQGGPAVIAIFTNQNRGSFFELEATLGRIAERVVQQWR
jgi:beta-lactamase class A